MIPIYIGFDPKEQEAYEVCEYSIRQRASVPVEIKPISSAHSLYDRQEYSRNGTRYDQVDGRPFSTDFSFARFLVPAIQKFEGWAVFMDCDFLILDDVAKLMEHADPERAVYVVQRRHVPLEPYKWGGHVQALYPRKNWSSFVLWNCGHKANGILSPHVVNEAKGRSLHTFEWLREEEIGKLPASWNHLVGYDAPLDTDHLQGVHYTSGGPWFKEYKDCDYADLWFDERDKMKKAHNAA